MSRTLKDMFIKFSFIGLLLLATSTVTFAQAELSDKPGLPVGMSLEYSFYRGNIKLGTMQRTLTQADDNRYVLESRTQATGFIAMLYPAKILERSTFTFDKGRAKPLTYLYERSGGKKARHHNLQFDWQNNQVSDNTQDEPWILDIPTNTVDRHLYQLNVMFDMQAEPSMLQYLVADRGKLKTYKIENLGSETVHTPLGDIETIKLQRKSANRSTTVWVAKQYHYLPVQIEQNEKGEKFRSVIKKVSGL